MAGTELGKAYVQIVPTAQGIKGSITNLLSGESEAAGKASGIRLGTAAKAGLAAAAAGIGAVLTSVVKGAMDEGAKLQQSYFGGLDTLYGDAADKAREYADAAASAGISMNTFSEQAVSFGAALKKAYKGDATKAIEAANTAILDMADNSAKMGTNITSVQDAYAGFAKQNYTMLDNLKLGYGGTKTEMERLLQDAEKLSGQEYNIDNLGDVYEAIHVIQQDLGLTGVAANEAANTFSGSMGAMKAAADNFLGNLAIGGDVSESLNILLGNVSTFFFNNMLPMLGTILQALPGAIMTFLQIGVPMFVANIQGLISQIATNVTALAKGITGQKVAEWVNANLPRFISAASSLIGQFASAMISNMPKIAAALARIGAAIVRGLGSALWGKVSAAAKGIYDKFMAPIEKMRDKFKAIIDKIKGWFPFNIGKIIKFQLPKITLNKKTATVLGKSITYPAGFSLSWHAKGGIFTQPTLLQGSNGALHGVGDVRGGEAIIPLKELWDHLDGAGMTINVYGNANSTAADIAAEVERRIIAMQKRRRMAW